jgi:ABC-2 type transport system ATP-binding protein
MSSSESAIYVDNISKWYGDFQAVKELSFEVRYGEVFALLGPNGAGKSTSIRMILDIIKPDAGTIRVLGGPMSEATKNRIGYLPEERGLYKDVKVLEMMIYLGKLKGMSGADAKREATALLEQLDLGAHTQKKVEELSKGMQQKVQFAVTVMHKPDLIIIDEPFSGLDPVNRIVIKNLLEDFRNRGGAVVMSTHQMNQVEEMADRMLMISHGEQKLYGDVDTIRRNYASHAIIVKGRGDWEKLPGVVGVEMVNDKRRIMRLSLAADMTSDQVLAVIAQDDAYQIDRFELAIPSLNQVFIQVAGEKAYA